MDNINSVALIGTFKMQKARHKSQLISGKLLTIKLA